MTYSRGMERAHAEMIERSAQKLIGWYPTIVGRTDGRFNVSLSQPRGTRTATIVGPGGYDDFLQAEGHDGLCHCPACEQWWADVCADQDRRAEQWYGEQQARKGGRE